MRLRQIVEDGELAFRIVADFTDNERVLALPLQQEITGVHPHEFVLARVHYPDMDSR